MAVCAEGTEMEEKNSENPTMEEVLRRRMSRSKRISIINMWKT